MATEANFLENMPEELRPVFEERLSQLWQAHLHNARAQSESADQGYLRTEDVAAWEASIQKTEGKAIRTLSSWMRESAGEQIRAERFAHQEETTACPTPS